MSWFACAPRTPEAIDWSHIEETFPPAALMMACDQDAVHHAEGDVWTHTRMVVEAMVGLGAYQGSDERTRRILFCAALLHDVGKPSTSVVVDGDRISSPAHARRGETIARSLLWRCGVEFAEREQICALVRHHQLPFFLVDSNDATRRLLLTSLRARCDWLALLAEADMRGRECLIQEQSLVNVALFLEMAQEARCLSAPREFPSANARFTYFRSDRRDPDYDPWFVPRCRVTVMSGLPGAGKDTWLRTREPDLPVVSLDALREELDVAPTEGQRGVVQAARERAREMLRSGESFAWNATNISRDLRQRTVSLAADYGAEVRIVYLEPSEVLLRGRNGDRADRVPDDVIDRLLLRWQVPDLSEAHEVVYEQPS